MNNLVVVPLIATICFCLAKLLERRYLIEENDKFALKFIVRDTVMVFAVTLLANFVYHNLHLHIDSFFNVITDTKTLPSTGLTEIFTDTPNF